MEKGRISSYCLKCILEKQEKKYALVKDENKREEYRKAVEEAVAGRSPSDSAPVLVSRLEKVQEQFLGKQDIFSEIKAKYNRIMMMLAPDIQTKIRDAEDSLAQALIFARAGNFIDFGAMHDVDDEIMERLLREAPGLRPDPEEYGAFRIELFKAKKLVYLTDNCGEIVLDKLFIQEIKKEYPKLEITVIVRGAPVINDATMDDAVMTGLTELPGIRVIGNGSAVAGTELSLISEEAYTVIKQADVMISKGQGNFETLHGCGMNIYYLFLCKCDWFSINLNLPKLSGVFKNERNLGRK